MIWRCFKQYIARLFTDSADLLTRTMVPDLNGQQIFRTLIISWLVMTTHNPAPGSEDAKILIGSSRFNVTNTENRWSNCSQIS